MLGVLVDNISRPLPGRQRLGSAVQRAKLKVFLGRRDAVPRKILYVGPFDSYNRVEAVLVFWR